MRELLGYVMKAIQQLTMKFEDDYVSAFWLSNNYELMSVMKTATSPSLANQDDEQSASAVLAVVNNDFKKVMLDIYNSWIKEFKRRLSNMIVPAVIENQSGLVTGSLWFWWHGNFFL